MAGETTTRNGDTTIRDGLALLRTLHRADALLKRLGCAHDDGAFVLWIAEEDAHWLEVLAVRLSGASVHARPDGTILGPVLIEGGVIRRFRLGSRFEVHYVAAE